MQLISNVLISEKDRELVVAMIHYLTEKGCKVVAEGVEDAETNQFLVSRSHGSSRVLLLNAKADFRSGLDFCTII